MSLNQATVTVAHDGSAKVRFTYDREAVERLKLAVPSYARKYDPSTHAWTIDAVYVTAAITALTVAFGAGNVHVRRPEPPRRAQSHPVTDWAQSLHDTLPPRLQKPAFRALIRVLHPDTGGDKQLSQQLIDAFRDAS